MKTFLLAFACSAIFAVVLGLVIIPLLKRLKFGQNILSYVEEHKHKNGTPTMGGFIFILSSITTFFIFCEGDKRLATVSIVVFLSYGAVGFIDDFIKIKRVRNEGLSVLQKAAFELVIAVIVSVFAYTRGLTRIIIPFTRTAIDLSGWIFVPLSVLVFVATTNSVNLTDGLDGLAASVSCTYLLAFAAIALLQDGFIENGVLQTDEHKSIALFAVCLSGALFGFLAFNVNRASVFMGDTGSLALGGAIASTATVSGNALYIPILGITFVASCISVILQVAYFKATKGRRLFLMAPLHHHFQHAGYAESKISFVYALITALAGVACVVANI